MYPDAGSSGILPLFPLRTVLMPGCPLPLRVFEPRYRKLLHDVTLGRKPHRFGVVALTAGLEVDTGLDDAAPLVADVGTVAEVLEVHPCGDPSAALTEDIGLGYGRDTGNTDFDTVYDIYTGGTQRFRVNRLVDGVEPYLQAEVTYLDEPLGDLPPALAPSARALAVEYARLIDSLTGDDTRSRRAQDYPDDEMLLSYRLAGDAPLSQQDHQLLLEDPTVTARLLHVQRVLRREVILVRRTRSIAVSPAVLQLALRPN